MLKNVGATVDLVVYLTLAKEEAIKRMASRRTASAIEWDAAASNPR